jgi:Skp family chaperone for outer membrane proteins
MHTLIVVLASASCLLFGFAAATHLGARARSLLTDKLKTEKERALSSSKKELGTLREEVKKLKASNDKGKEDTSKSDKLKKDLKKAEDSHAKEVDKLQKKLAEVEAINAGGNVKKLESALKKAGKGLDDILNAFIKDQGQTAALLCDGDGIVIAKAGDGDTIDGAAAAASTLTGIPKKLSGMVPLENHFSYRLADGSNSIVGHTFESAGELIALTTVGTEPPSANAMKSTLASLNSALE